MRKFTIKYPDGSISIVTVADNSTNEEIISKNSKYSTNVSYSDVDETYFPPSKYARFRDAWSDDGNGVLKIDMVKAKDIILEDLRQIRNKKLDRLDSLEFKANGTGNNTLFSSVQQDKQALRDATEGLKGIAVSGYNDYATLDALIDAAVLPATNN